MSFVLVCFQCCQDGTFYHAACSEKSSLKRRLDQSCLLSVKVAKAWTLPSVILQITHDEIVVIENISVETSDNGRAVRRVRYHLVETEYFRSTTISELVIDVIRPSKEKKRIKQNIKFLF